MPAYRTRRHVTADQKTEIVRRHSAGQEPVSELADELGLQPSRIHLWINQVFAQTARAFERGLGNGRVEKAKNCRIEVLEAKLVQMSEVIAELRLAKLREKSQCGVSKKCWLPPDLWAEVVVYIGDWTGCGALRAETVLGWLGLSPGKFHRGKGRYGHDNQHNGKVPRDVRLPDTETQAILDYHDRYPREGYRWLSCTTLTP